MIKVIDGGLLKNVLLKSSEALEKSKHRIDAMNVFPVPDGDTGTNMSATLSAAAKELGKLNDFCSVSDVVKAVTFGSLRGARGNSGVILSQLFRGFSKELETCETAGAEQLANAFLKASDTAYRAVMKPKEGTILTVARELGERFLDLSFEKDDLVEIFGELITYGNKVLGSTVDMLPQLKQAGVVDAGGQGLMLMISSIYTLVSGVEVDYPYLGKGLSGDAVDYSSLAEAGDDIQYEYCTEFFVNYPDPVSDDTNEIGMKCFLETIGDSIVVVADDKLMKVHVHTNVPGSVLEKAMQMGYLSNIKIENMKLQHNEKISFLTEGVPTAAVKPSGPRKAVGFVSVSSGDGFADIFKSLNADAVVEGGQTLNPSTEDILKAIDSVNADDIFVLPNNKNIILAAQQAGELCEGKRVRVIPTRTVPEGINAMLSFAVPLSAEENEKRMTKSISEITTGQITSAVRDTTLDGFEIKTGDMLSILGGKIVGVKNGCLDAAMFLAGEMLRNSADIFSIFYGEGVGESEAGEFSEMVHEKYPDIEIDLQYGGQPVYQYVLSAQ